MSINACAKFVGIKRGSHHIPRFIYHITSKSNYEKMIQSGSIRPTQDALMTKGGIFACDLINLFKNWGKNKAWGNKSLLGRLLLFTNKNNSDIVLLKIPTSKLSLPNLKIRSQNRYLGWRNKIFTADNPVVQKICEILDPKSAQKAKQTLCRSTDPKNASHIIDGSPATSSKLFNQRKEAIEYVYQGGEIPMKYVKKLGEANLSEIVRNPDQTMSFVKKVFLKLLQGTPESQAASHLLK